MRPAAAPAVGAGEAAAARRAWLESSRARVRREFSAPAGGDGLAVVQLRAPTLAIDSALRALQRLQPGSAILWDPPTGAAFAASGSAARLEVDAGGLPGLRARGQDLWSRLRSVDLDGSGAPGPRLFGGAAFAPAAGHDPPWTAHGDGWFTLPQLRYGLSDGQGWLAIAGEGSAGEVELAEAALAALAEAQHQVEAAPSEGDGAPPPRIEQLPAAQWAAMIDEILAGIAGGRFEKVVAARRAEVVAGRPLDPLAVLGRMRAAASGCVRFGLARGGSTFVGVTPELLVARERATVRTEALAGSIALDGSGADSAATAIMESAKDRAEHALVVREITRRLAPLCTRLHVAAAPRTRALQHLLHLLTPIEGQLSESTHVLDLAAALHPTPAVGGLPVAAALDRIVRREPAARGWYAGPIGWFDAAGDGCLMVALRCAVIEGARAWLWAGAGIVAGSSAAGEYAETELKQRAVLGGLGLAEVAR